MKAGCANIQRHIENSRKFGVPTVVAINRFATDTPAELQVCPLVAPILYALCARALVLPDLCHCHVNRRL